jgi:ribosomal protein S18 acetylase RimI-like enzyme
MTLNVTVRSARPDECPLILELWEKAGSIPSSTASVDDLMKYIREDSDLLLVAEVDNHIVGTVMGGWDGWRGNIYRLAVLPDYRLQGIGRALVDETERRLARKGARKISILVGKEEDIAVHFWDALKDTGYELDKRVIRYTKML